MTQPRALTGRWASPDPHALRDVLGPWAVDDDHRRNRLLMVQFMADCTVRGVRCSAGDVRGFACHLADSLIASGLAIRASEEPASPPPEPPPPIAAPSLPHGVEAREGSDLDGQNGRRWRRGDRR